MKDNRLHYLDAAKGFGMLAIIAGHMGHPEVEKFVFSFHVPLFFIISGYLYSYKKDYTRRIKHMLIPYFMTAMGLLVLTDIREILKGLRSMNFAAVSKNTVEYVFATIYGSGVRQDFLSYRIKPIGAIWFLLALLISQLIFDFVNQVIKNNKLLALRNISIVLTFVSVISARYTWLPFSVQAAGVGSLFMYCGLMIKELKLEDKKHLAMVGIAIWAVALFYSYRFGNMSVAECLFPNLIPNVLGAICGSYVIVSFFAWIEKKSARNAVWEKLCLLGEFSTAVLCVHLIEIRVVPWHFLKEQDYILMPFVIFSLKVCIAFITATICRKRELVHQL